MSIFGKKGCCFTCIALPFTMEVASFSVPIKHSNPIVVNKKMDTILLMIFPPILF